MVKMLDMVCIYEMINFTTTTRQIILNIFIYIYDSVFRSVECVEYDIW